MATLPVTGQLEPAGKATTPAIELQHIVQQFGKFKALNDLSFTVNRGEIFGLLGPNGSGKTTTINIISGLSQPTSGTVQVLGYDLAKNRRAVRMSLGAVPQETALYEELSAYDNMMFHAGLYNIPRRETQGRIKNLLTLVKLEERQNERVANYSGGMKRRLALARALLHDPDLIYLDEPTLGVDVQSRRAIWEYILDLKTRGKTILITTNYLEEANFLCDRLAILDHGKLIDLDTPQHLKQAYGDIILELETEKIVGENIIGEIKAFPNVGEVTQKEQILKIIITGEPSPTGQIINLLAQQTGIKTINQREPDLDEVFLSLTGKTLRD